MRNPRLFAVASAICALTAMTTLGTSPSRAIASTVTPPSPGTTPAPAVQQLISRAAAIHAAATGLSTYAFVTQPGHGASKLAILKQYAPEILASLSASEVASLANTYVGQTWTLEVLRTASAPSGNTIAASTTSPCFDPYQCVYMQVQYTAVNQFFGDQVYVAGAVDTYRHDGAHDAWGWKFGRLFDHEGDGSGDETFAGSGTSYPSSGRIGPGSCPYSGCTISEAHETMNMFVSDMGGFPFFFHPTHSMEHNFCTTERVINQYGENDGDVAYYQNATEYSLGTPLDPVGYGSGGYAFSCDQLNQG